MKKFITLLLTSLLFTQAHTQLTWTLSNTNIPQGLVITCFALAPNGHIYLAGKGVNSSLQWYPVLYRSANNGITWSGVTLPGGLNVREPHALVFTGNKLLMGGESTGGYEEVIVSADLGNTWSVASSGVNLTYRVKDFAVAPNGDVYLMTVGFSSNGVTKLYKTSNAGTSWTEINIVDLTPFLEPSAIMFDQNSKLYLSALGLQSYLGRNLLFTSTNFGQNWLPQKTGIPVSVTVMDLVRGKGSDIFAIGTQTTGTNPDTYTYRILKTTNFGSNWTTVSPVTGLTDLTEPAYAFSNNGYLMMSGKGTAGEAYVFKSTLVAPPTVTTTAPFVISDTAAGAGGKLLDDGALPITKRGICWGLSPNPNLSSYIAEGAALTDYTVQLSGLQPGTKYYLKAFATNSQGTSFGNELNFTTLDFTGIGESGPAESQFDVYPSPASDVLYIKGNKMRGDERFCLYDVLGSKVLELEIVKGLNTIDISALPPGCYFLETGGYQRYKVVKQ